MSGFDYNSVMDEVEKNHGLITADLNKAELRSAAISTGVLVQDLITGGGVQPAWNVWWGGEGAAKSTTVMSIVGNTTTQEVPLVPYYDYEQALDPEYFSNNLKIINPNGIYDQVFGVRNIKTGKWDVPPKVRYYPHDVGEDFYLSVGDLLRALPDKLYMDGKWWYVYPKTREGQRAAKGYNKVLLRKHNKFFVEAEDGSRIQALIIIDSIQAMNPDSQETGKLQKQMAQAAAMHSKHIGKVWSKLRRKHCAVVAIGQLRVNPGQMFGNKEYSPGGNALKHAASVRNKLQARSSPNGNGPIETEASVLSPGATDSYKYIYMKNEKNKFYTPAKDGWLRVWVDNHEGEGQGFDPVYDCFQYLSMTGRIVGYIGGNKGKTPTKMTIHWPENGFLMMKISWLTFKELVLFGIYSSDYKAQLKETCLNIGLLVNGKAHNPKIRERCFGELKDGIGYERYQQACAGLLEIDTTGLDIDDEEDEDDIEFEEEDE